MTERHRTPGRLAAPSRARPGGRPSRPLAGPAGAPTPASPEAAVRAVDTMRADVAEGLSRDPKELPPKYFYDRRGSELFEEITRLPEYYLTRAERALLPRAVAHLIPTLRPAALVELGAGAAEKTRAILDAMTTAATGAVTYVPVDISADFLDDVADALRGDYPRLRVRPVVADIARGLALPARLPRPALFALLGSTIGNFTPDAAGRLLARVRDAMEPTDRFLLGVDLVKDTSTLEAAYNDGAGVTAEFNRNVLRVLNRELGADFDLDSFNHRAFYDGERRRIEMHLVADRPMTATVPGAGRFHFEAGESIRTELSHKYDRAAVERVFRAAGFVLERWISGADPGHADAAEVERSRASDAAVFALAVGVLA